jgi:hypothetical protein
MPQTFTSSRRHVPILNRIGLFAPDLDIVVGPVVDAVKRIDPDLVVVRNRRSMRPNPARGDDGTRYEVYDRRAPGGPKWQLVMRVQEPDGSFRPLDGRVIPTLLEAKGRPVSKLLDRIEAQEEARERAIDRRIQNLSEDMYEMIWTLGHRIHGYGGPTVAWQARTDPEARQRIRREAGLA